MSFILDCPRCKAKPEEARLEVIGGTFSTTGMPLREDGFYPTDAKRYETDDEIVFCNVCEAVFPLGECLDPNT